MDIESCIEVAYTSMSLRDLATAISWNQSPEELIAYIQVQHVRLCVCMKRRMCLPSMKMVADGN